MLKVSKLNLLINFSILALLIYLAVMSSNVKKEIIEVQIDNTAKEMVVMSDDEFENFIKTLLIQKITEEIK